MNKQEQIDELKKALAEVKADRTEAWLKVTNLRNEAAARDERERNAKSAKAALDKTRADDEAIRRIERDGLIPVAELRSAWYQTQSERGGISIAFRFYPDAGQGRVGAAVLKALMEPVKPKPVIKFATGGYTGYPAYAPTGNSINLTYLPFGGAW